MVERLIHEKFAKKLGLVNLEIKELKEKTQDLKQKYFQLHKKVKNLESKRAEASDQGA